MELPCGLATRLVQCLSAFSWSIFCSPEMGAGQELFRDLVLYDLGDGFLREPRLIGIRLEIPGGQSASPALVGAPCKIATTCSGKDPSLLTIPGSTGADGRCLGHTPAVHQHLAGPGH